MLLSPEATHECMTRRPRRALKRTSFQHRGHIRIDLFPAAGSASSGVEATGCGRSFLTSSSSKRMQLCLLILPCRSRNDILLRHLGHTTTGLPPGVWPTTASGSVSNIVAGSGGASGTVVSCVSMSWSVMPSRLVWSRTALISAGWSILVRRFSLLQPLRK